MFTRMDGLVFCRSREPEGHQELVGHLPLPLAGHRGGRGDEDAFGQAREIELNPHRPRAFGGKGAEGMKKEIPSSLIHVPFLGTGRPRFGDVFCFSGQGTVPLSGTSLITIPTCQKNDAEGGANRGGVARRASQGSPIGVLYFVGGIRTIPTGRRIIHPEYRVYDKFS